MKAKFLILIISLFLTVSGLTQTTGYYYYNGQSKSVVFSNRIIFAHFNPNLTNSQKQSVITGASVDLLDANYSNIPDYVKLQSRIISGWHWVYPCLIESVAPKGKDSTKLNIKDKPDPNYVPLPCEGCPDCTPRWEYYEYNNLENALYLLSNNTDVRSVSKGFSYSSSNVATTGTEENFYFKIKPAYTINDFTTLLSGYNFTAQDVSVNFGIKVYKVSVPRESSLNLINFANIFYNTGMCEYSTPNFLQISKISNTTDPRWPEQWGLLNTGQYNGIQGADIRAVNAWQFSKGANVKVAVIDDGMYENTTDLVGNLLPGYNAIPGSTLFLGEHGSKVAGVIAAIADNNIDITGVAPESKIIPVKIYNWDSDAADIGLADQFTKGINWAIDAGAEILNCSWGADWQSDMLDLAITDGATNGRFGKGCIVVFSSGNDNNLKQKFPSSTHPMVITVGAMTHCNSRKSPESCDPNTGFASPEFNDWGSNYGSYLSLVAPGSRIATVNVDPIFQSAANITGTSAAAPMVSGVAALMLSINPNLTRVEVKKIIELSSNKVGNYCYNWTPAHPNGGWSSEMGYGRLNAYNAVQLSRPGVTISNPVYNVLGQTSSVVTGNIGILFSGTACPTSLPFGLAFLRRHEVRTNITYPYTPNPVIICNSNGFNQANPNDGRRWAEALNVTNTSATLRSYIYYGYNSIGQELGWIPAVPTSISFNYVIVGSPTAIDYQLIQRNTADSSIFVSKLPFKLELNDKVVINDMPVDFTSNVIKPNPVSNTLTFQVNSEVEKIENVEIINSVGIKVKIIPNQKINKGFNVLTFNISELKTGVYILKYGTKSYKFLKK